MKTDSEKYLEEFVKSDYDFKNLDVTKIYPIAMELAVNLVPIQEIPTWEYQDRRGRTWPFLFARMIERLSFAHYQEVEKNKEQKLKIIELQKEISKLKRDNK